MHDRPVAIAITSGDPCGIGPEVILKALPLLQRRTHRWVVIGTLRVFDRMAHRLARRLPRWHATALDAWLRHPAWPAFIEIACPEPLTPGRVSAAAGSASVAYLEAAVQLARAERIDALVTAPVTKQAVEFHQQGFQGHTEYLAAALRARDPVMMFDSPRLRVCVLTRHMPLRRVPSAVTPRLIRTALLTTLAGLQHDFGIHRPRVAVCGLNPHAGEVGLFGEEEQRLLRPVLQQLVRAGHHIKGPFAADGLFASGLHYDAVVCWYHDQGLIPFKLLARDCGCQVTLGLPIVRTSPDHGSALDIAGTGRAHPGSMRYALEAAWVMARRRLRAGGRLRSFHQHAHALRAPSRA